MGSRAMRTSRSSPIRTPSASRSESPPQSCAPTHQGSSRRRICGPSGGDASGLPVLAWNYSDYVRWQREQLRSEDHREALAWWADRLRGLPRLELPFERNNLAPSYAGDGAEQGRPCPAGGGRNTASPPDRPGLHQSHRRAASIAGCARGGLGGSAADVYGREESRTMNAPSSTVASDVERRGFAHIPGSCRKTRSRPSRPIAAPPPLRAIGTSTR